MKYFTGVQEFAFNKLQEYRSLIPDAGVQVAVEFWNGNQWVEDDGSPISTPNDISCAGVRVKLTPTPANGGYGFDVDGKL